MQDIHARPAGRNEKISARSGAERKHFGSRRRYRRAFDFAPTRRREIERHARYVGAADSDDFSRWLIAWIWHNRKSTESALGASELRQEARPQAHRRRGGRLP
jgi:hypothetical protein